LLRAKTLNKAHEHPRRPRILQNFLFRQGVQGLNDAAVQIQAIYGALLHQLHGAVNVLLYQQSAKSHSFFGRVRRK